ncbi:MAG: class I SAM-dependent methyltransferase [Gemmatimonadetes bacterium]|nr:class I SAM-dependent methyltransferase [Gemmatimonadota bacterium]
MIASSSTLPRLPPENIYGHLKKLRFLQAALNRVAARRGGRIAVLDFGCGNGAAVTRFLAAPGVELHGVDIHAPSLEYARAHWPGIHFHDRVPGGMRWDAIVYADVLEHLDDPASTVREHVLHLAQDGIVAGAVPNGYGPFEMEKRIARWSGADAAVRAAGAMRRALGGAPHVSEGPPYNLDSGHVQFFTRRTLHGLLAGAGLRVDALANGAWLGAPLSERFLLRGERVARLNAAVADRLPAAWVSTWYFEASRAAV